MDQDWPQECKEKAEVFLPEALGLLSSEVSLFLSTIDINLIYTELTSRIHRRIGECSIFAEIAKRDDIDYLLSSLHSQIKNLYSGINIEGAKSDISDIIKKLDDIRATLPVYKDKFHKLDIANYWTEADA